MQGYIEYVKQQLKDWKVAVLAIVFLVARVNYSFYWLKSGWGKATTWLSDGTYNAAGKIQTLIANIAGPEVTRFDPLGINKFFAWVADTFFLGMPGLTDVLVVVFEIGCALAIIFGFKVFWAALIFMFMNVQFIASGSFNNFGFIWTNLIFMQLHKYVGLLGIDGYLAYRKGVSIADKKLGASPSVAK